MCHPKVQRILDKFYILIFQSDLHASRFTLGVAELVWGVTLLLPGNTFDRPTYAVMAHVGISEEIWGILWLFSSITQFYILFSGRYHEPPAVIFAGFNSILWWFVTVSMYLSVYPIPAAISGELALAISAAWIWIRTGWIPQIRDPRGFYEVKS
jgi:hypothetical protein